MFKQNALRSRYLVADSCCGVAAARLARALDLPGAMADLARVYRTAAAAVTGLFVSTTDVAIVDDRRVPVVWDMTDV